MDGGLITSEATRGICQHSAPGAPDHQSSLFNWLHKQKVFQKLLCL